VGGVPRAALEAAVGPVVAADAQAPAAPGTLASHYAPRALLIAVAAAEVPAMVAAYAPARVAVLAPAREFAAWPALPALSRQLPDEPAAMARELYAAMRDLDASAIDVIVAALPAEVGLGEAVADRLRRAAGPRGKPGPHE
jgi:L-threonylcarbamoyladenylate synthase